MEYLKDIEAEAYRLRCLDGRFTSYATATINLLNYLISLGNTEEEAKTKINELALEIGSEKVVFYLIGIKQPLIDSINGSLLSFMTSDAKIITINGL